MSQQLNLIVFYIFSAVTMCITMGTSDFYTEEDQNATPCGIGQFYYNTNVTKSGRKVYQRCKLCPIGTYNEYEGDVSQCSPCPKDDSSYGFPSHTRNEGAFSKDHCVYCAGWCERQTPSSCYTREQECDGAQDCAYGQDEKHCETNEPKEPTVSGYQKYSWFFFIPVPFVICAGFGKLYHTQKNRGLPVNAETGSPIRIHFRPHVSGRSRSRSRRSSQPVTIEMPLISNNNATNSPGNHTQVTRSPSNQSQRTRSSQGSVFISGQHLTVGVGDDRSSRRSSATSQRSRSGSHGSRSFSRSPKLGNDGDRQRPTSRIVQPAVLVVPNQLPPRHVPLRSSVSLPPFPFPSPMSTISHPPGSPPVPLVTSGSGSPPPPSYDEVVTSNNVYPQHSPQTDELPSYEAATRNPLLSTSSA